MRLQLLVTGIVQGVGFRPHVYRLARQMGLTGWVKNNALGLLIEVQGQLATNFSAALKIDCPPLAKIDDIQIQQMPLQASENTFQILESDLGPAHTMISPDTSICSLCLHDLFDKKSHYYLYPFLNCTHCGPRFTLTHQTPYDRCQTTMRTFTLCHACEQDFIDPANRRYHAQSIACAHCGPQLTVSIKEIAQYILDGEIVALKGLGGYQFIADAKNRAAIKKLREKKNRQAKPLALMVQNIASAADIVQLEEYSENLLMSKERPIVLLSKKNQSSHDSIAPNLSCYGIMLPSTPIHYLLFHALLGFPEGHEWINQFNPAMLVVTSANLDGTPIITKDRIAQTELKEITHKIIAYNREIVSGVDDSVIQIINKAPCFIRYARGQVPNAIKLPYGIPSTLALGAELKNTFCLTRDDQAFISQHIGSLNNKASIDFFHESLNHLMHFLNIKPLRVAHDLHPDFYTTHLAHQFKVPTYAVQHHHAHLAAVMAEHRIEEPALGLALDGYGYGTNKEAWGGELLLLEHITCQRVGCFYPLPLPGGERAVYEPWRMAAGVLHVLGLGNEISKRFHAHEHAQLLANMLDKKINTPLTSSCGRLFDAASAILGVNTLSTYEGQAAMELESLVTKPVVLTGGWRIEGAYFNMLPTLSQLFNTDPVEGANIFHGTLIAGLSEWMLTTAARLSINVVLLSGGCFLNKVLTEGIINTLSKQGLKLFLPRQVPFNDAGISFGQAWIAGRM